MAKSTVATFRVTKRFDLWVEKEIKAENFEQAVEISKTAKLPDFIQLRQGVSYIDYNTLPGLSVGEDW